LSLQPKDSCNMQFFRGYAIWYLSTLMVTIHNAPEIASTPIHFRKSMILYCRNMNETMLNRQGKLWECGSCTFVHIKLAG
jgi:hypothetical protein